MKAQIARARFREFLGGSSCVYPASVFDPLSARLAEDIGFEVGMFAGSMAALAVLAAPDVMVLTLTELAEQARRICRASGLPLLVDADHGYGGSLNVRRTVEELESAGVAGLTIEDTLLPTPFGATGKAALISVDEGVGKLRAALGARDDPQLAVIARTSALQITGMADALDRMRAYAATGVDAMFVVGVAEWDQLAEIRAAVELPLVLGNPGAALFDRSALAAHGVTLCLQGHQPMAAAVHALHATLRSLREGDAADRPAALASVELMQKSMRSALYSEWTERFGGVGARR